MPHISPAQQPRHCRAGWCSSGPAWSQQAGVGQCQLLACSMAWLYPMGIVLMCCLGVHGQRCKVCAVHCPDPPWQGDAFRRHGSSSNWGSAHAHAGVEGKHFSRASAFLSSKHGSGSVNMAEGHCAYSHSLPGSVMCRRAAWSCFADIKALCASLGWQVSRLWVLSWGSSAGAQGTPGVSLQPCLWLGIGLDASPSPASAAPVAVRHSRSCRFGVGGCASQLLKTCCPVPTALRDSLLPKAGICAYSPCGGGQCLTTVSIPTS